VALSEQVATGPTLSHRLDPAVSLCSTGIHVHPGQVWEYEVIAEHRDAFVAAYGVDGDWAHLFKRGRGYVCTELYRSTGDDARFVTVDRWRDEAAWRAFLEEWGEVYAGLDTTMTRLTKSQRSLLEGPR